MDQSPAVPWEITDPRDVLCAALDRLIPADDFPGALDAGVERSLVRQLTGDAREQAPLIVSGLRALNAEAEVRFGASFAALGSTRQDEVLEMVEAGTVRAAWPVSPVVFFTTLLELTNEGYYADAGESGPVEMISWRMIGYRSGPNPAHEVR
jgi:hypothetical protein